MAEHEQLSTGQRWLGRVAGLLLAPVALFIFGLLGIGWTVAAIMDGDAGQLVIGLLSVGLGAILVDASARLILGRPRSGGRLLHPAVVVGSRLMMLVGFVLAILTNEPGWLPDSLVLRALIAVLALAAYVGWHRPRDPGESTGEPETMEAEVEVGKAALDRIRSELSRFGMDTYPYDVRVNAILSIPPQAGLDFSVVLSVHEDELHLDVGSSFGGAWFPTGDESVVKDHLDAVRGVLTGTYRVVEHRRWGKPFTAELQKPHQGGWKRAYTSGSLGALIPISFRKTILQNRGVGSSVTG